jgi:ketosteroid isomerase-like protein
MEADVKTKVDVKSNVNDLIGMITKGQLLEAFEKYYADDVVMQENNDPPRVGKDANREFEKQFISGVEQVHDSQIKNVAYSTDGKVVMIQSYMDITMKGVGRQQMEEVAVQTWKNGKIVNEKFFYKGA